MARPACVGMSWGTGCSSNRSSTGSPIRSNSTRFGLPTGTPVTTPSWRRGTTGWCKATRPSAAGFTRTVTTPEPVALHLDRAPVHRHQKAGLQRAARHADEQCRLRRHELGHDDLAILLDGEPVAAAGARHEQVDRHRSAGVGRAQVLAAATYWPITRSSTSSGSAPDSRPASWKRRMSNFGPSAARAWARSRSQVSLPTM